MLLLSAAHRDPRAYKDPDRFDVERDLRSHLAFGGGIHFCLGAHLARMEAQIAILRPPRSQGAPSVHAPPFV